MELITGHGGTPHISSADVGALLAGVVSENKYCFGDAPTLALINANTLSIGPAELLLNGRHIRITEAETVTIESGSVGYYRKDLVVCRYSYNTSTRVESVEWIVVTGTASSTSAGAVDPTTEYMNTSILDGALIVDIPVVRVTLNGLTPTAECLVPEMPSMHELAQSIVDNTAAIATLRDSLDQKIKNGTASSDANDYKSEGRFAVSTGNTMSNMPSNAPQYGILIVLTSEASNAWHRVFQVYATGTGVWSRVSFDGNWNSWSKLSA